MSLLLAGCGSGGGFFRGKTDTIPTYEFRKGTEGLAMKFVDGMPPPKVFVGTEFSTGLMVKNMGSYDITGDATLKITVPDDTAFQFQGSNPQTFALTGKSLYIKEGQEDIVLFPMKALCFPGYNGKQDAIVKNYTRKIKATACYYYQTTSNADLCIDTLKYKRQKSDKPPCKMQDLKLSGGQGGPVGVLSISPTLIPKSGKTSTVQIGISIKKLRGRDHRVFHPTASCDVNEENKVRVEVELGKQKLKCAPAEVTIKEASPVSTICKLDVDNSLGAYKTPITVKMEYYIQQNLLKDLRVEPSPGGDDCKAIKAGK
jgi:hypothetical protein